MKRKTLLLTLLAVTLCGHAQYKSQVWSPDNGDGTYTNPVINADYSDPDVCVGSSGDDYYMTASSFQCIPGLPSSFQGSRQLAVGGTCGEGT